MKVSIYGDSFADPLVANLEFIGDNIAWPDIVGETHQVINYARGGTSTYYSYNKFLETYQHDDSDCVIFITTDYYRWYHLLQNNKVKSAHGDEYHAIPTPVMCDYWRNNSKLKKQMTTEFEDQLSAIDSYFMFLKNEKFDETICSLMLEDIQRKRPDTIFITGGTFHGYHSLIEPDKSISKFALSWVKNWPEYEKQIVGFLPWEEKRISCHLAKEVNELVAVEVLRAIDDRCWDPIIPEFIEAENKDFSYYYNVSGFNWAKRK